MTNKLFSELNEGDVFCQGNHTFTKKKGVAKGSDGLYVHYQAIDCQDENYWQFLDNEEVILLEDSNEEAVTANC